MPPHLRYPFRFNSGGGADVVEQDSIEEIMQSVQVILTTTIGERIEVPDFGVSSLVFSEASRTQGDTLVRQINQQEKRAETTLDISIDRVDQLVQHITAHVQAVTSGSTSDSTGLVNPDVVVTETDSGYGAGGWGVQPWGA